MAADYSKTVHLPRTRFPMKADLPKREPLVAEFWEKEGIYERMEKKSTARPLFVLHDGPPYANGPIHIGHALNKILKDIVVKSRSLMGRPAPYIPGWDCHGLPIEHALLKELKMDKRGVVNVAAFRDKAKAFAEKFIDLQRSEFRRLGCLGDWAKPYVTLSKEYESRVLRAFRVLYEKGYIYRGLKPVYWCASCETALAEAEIEYKNKRSPSVFVALPIRHPGDLARHGAEALVWTTTPWTLPANMAVAFHPELEYVLAEVELAGDAKPRRLLLARARLEAVLRAVGAARHKVLRSWKGKELAPATREGRRTLDFVCEAPFGGRDSVGVLGDFVTAEDGTGIVHVAPGHGADDFYAGRKYGLEILCPIDGAGRFTEQAGDFAGKHVFKEGNGLVLEALRGAGRLLRGDEIEHSYPHCWRCKNPIVFRATEQWFLNVGHAGLRDRLLTAIDEVRWVPAEGKARISGMVQSRPDWCLSRQRLWGTPIPVLYCLHCHAVLDSPAVMEAVEQRVAREGSNFWFERPGSPVYLCTETGEQAKLQFAAQFEAWIWDFMPSEEVSHCRKCNGRKFRRETDILDVWVDSGASWLAVLEPRDEAPCDLYLEGSDQHRGWFQSSLVLSVALTGRAPYKAVLTHGFVLDDQGRAMHKSLGNVVSPQEVIEKCGADVLRLWVALADYSDDVRLSAKLLEGPTDAYRKIRNTFRYLLGNTFDFDPVRHSVPFDRMKDDMDRYVLHRLGDVIREVRSAYEEYQFRSAARTLTDFCNLQLSSFYLDACKDRLYTLAADAPERRSAQTVLFETLRVLATLAAPILSFTAEEAWAEMRRALSEQKSSCEPPQSVFLAEVPEPAWSEPALAERWKAVFEVRARVNKAIEEARAAGLVGGSLQAKVRLKGGGNGERAVLEAYRGRWPEILIVSQAEIQPGDGALTVEVAKADGAKCARCWRWQADVGANARHPDLCSRCVAQLRT